MRYPEVFKAASGIVIAMPPKSYRYIYLFIATRRFITPSLDLHGFLDRWGE